jgi:hypothetical protein
LHQLRRGFDQMLEAVEHQQQVPRRQGPGQQLIGRLVGRRQPERPADALGQARRPLHIAQGDELHAVGKPVLHLLGQRRRQPRLADAAGRGDGDQARALVVLQPVLQLAEFGLAAEQGRGSRRGDEALPRRRLVRRSRCALRRMLAGLRRDALGQLPRRQRRLESEIAAQVAAARGVLLRHQIGPALRVVELDQPAVRGFVARLGLHQGLTDLHRVVDAIGGQVALGQLFEHPDLIAPQRLLMRHKPVAGSGRHDEGAAMDLMRARQMRQCGIAAMACARVGHRLREALHIDVGHHGGIEPQRAALKLHQPARVGDTGAAEDAAQRVQRVVQPVRRSLHARLRPQRFGRFVARHLVPRRQAQHLPQQPRVLELPTRAVDRGAVDADGEATEQRGADMHRFEGFERLRRRLHLVPCAPYAAKADRAGACAGRAGAGGTPSALTVNSPSGVVTTWPVLTAPRCSVRLVPSRKPRRAAATVLSLACSGLMRRRCPADALTK